MDDNRFDVIVLGTGLSESITAAALAKAGLKVAHVDPNPYYGAEQATLTLDELIEWAESHKENPTEAPGSVHYRIDYLSPDRPPHAKQYSVSLSPSVIPSTGPFISSIISSGVARYGSYKLLGPIAIYRNGMFHSVPRSKESIFQDRSIPLVEKRRLMRFLAFASGEFEKSPELEGKEETLFSHFLQDSFSLTEEISQVIMYTLAGCQFSTETTSTALRRVRSCLRSAGRYGSSPFLVGYYGGTGEVIQGFCRAAAVNGGVYILGRKVSGIVVNEAQDSERFAVELEDFSDRLRSSFILSSMSCVPQSLRTRVNPIPSDPKGFGTTRSQGHVVARCIGIVHGTLNLPSLYGTGEIPPIEGQSDSVLIIFPPGSLVGGSMTSAVTLLTGGVGTMSAPSETTIIYLSMPLHGQGNSRDLLHPYLSAILNSNPTCKAIFQLFYLEWFLASPLLFKDTIVNLLAFSPVQPNAFQDVDDAALAAKNAFLSIIQTVAPSTICHDSIWFVDSENLE